MILKRAVSKAVKTGDLVALQEVWNDSDLHPYYHVDLLLMAFRYHGSHIAQWLVDEKGFNIATPDVLFTACRDGNFEMLKWLVIDNHVNVHQKQKRGGRTILFIACRRPHFIDVVQWLVIEMNVNIHIKDRRGIPPLHETCMAHSCIAITRFLLMVGATIEAIPKDLLEGLYYRDESLNPQHRVWKSLFEEIIQQRSNVEYLKEHIAQYPSMLADAPPELQQDHDLLLLALGTSTDNATIVDKNTRNWCSLYRDSITYYLQEEHYTGQHAHIQKFYSTVVEQLDCHDVFDSIFLFGVYYYCNTTTSNNHNNYEHINKKRKLLLLTSEQQQETCTGHHEKKMSTTTATTTTTSPLSILNQGKETSQAILNKIAEYAGVPMGAEHLRRLHNARKNIEQYSPAAVVLARILNNIPQRL